MSNPCLFCTNGCEICNPTASPPSWFIAGKNTPKLHISNVARGLHPLGFKLGTEGENTCKSCRHLVINKWGRTYYKCGRYAKNNKSTSSDIRLKWRACENYDN